MDLEYSSLLLDELREVAISAAREAAVLAADGRREGVVVAGTKSSATDIVTEMDRRVEALLVDRILTARPDDGMLGEEGASHVGSNGVRWVLDPIDGTVNYLYGIPSWGVSVAAEIDGVGVVGVVAAPMLGETFVAVRGRGAHKHDQWGVHELRVNDPVELTGSLVGTGYGYTQERRIAQARVTSALLPYVGDLRRLGSCSIDLCYVAEGRFDAYYERGVHLWDYAAAALVVTEAGGVFGGLNGRGPSEDLVIAAGPNLYRGLHDVLRDNGADTDG
ncbi:MAG: inositol monophosphatase family protein [Actinomycetes bacterium]